MSEPAREPSTMTVDELVDLEMVRSIRRLYSHYVDGGDIESLSMLFTEDAVCEFGPAFGGDWVGREQIKVGYQSQFDLLGGDAFASLHAVTNASTVLTGDGTATGRHYLLDFVTTGDRDQNPLRLLGIYDDTYVKKQGRWLINHTRIDFIWPKRRIWPN